MRYSTNRSALSGIVQSLLITRHMLFVGFSLKDDNFHRIIDVRRRRKQGRGRREEGGGRRKEGGREEEGGGRIDQ
jgi:hypothetical protein